MVMIFISIKKGDLPGSWKDVATMLNGLEGTRYVAKGQRSVFVGVGMTLRHVCPSQWSRMEESQGRKGDWVLLCVWPHLMQSSLLHSSRVSRLLLNLSPCPWPHPLPPPQRASCVFVLDHTCCVNQLYVFVFIVTGCHGEVCRMKFWC